MECPFFPTKVGVDWQIVHCVGVFIKWACYWHLSIISSHENSIYTGGDFWRTFCAVINVKLKQMITALFEWNNKDCSFMLSSPLKKCMPWSENWRFVSSKKKRRLFPMPKIAKVGGVPNFLPLQLAILDFGATRVLVIKSWQGFVFFYREEQFSLVHRVCFCF